MAITKVYNQSHGSGVGTGALINPIAEISLIGRKVKIIDPDISGKIVEVIFGTQGSIHYKIRAWLEFVPNYIVLERK